MLSKYMPTPAFCALEDVYSDWNFKEPDVNQTRQLVKKQPQQQSEQQPQTHPSLKPIQKYKPSNNHFEKQESESDTVYIPKDDSIKSFCPNCQNCLKANNVLQQRIIEQTITPRPRWTPQEPHAYTQYDPYNRYWSQNVPQSHIQSYNHGREDFNVFANGYEHFTNGIEYFGNKPNFSTEILLQVILFILVALFVIQLVECMYAKCS